MTFSPAVAAMMFGASFVLDAVYTKYVEYVADHRAGAAAIICLFWHAVSAAMVFAYAQNGIYIAFVTLGGAAGTFCSISLKARRQIADG